MPNLGPFRQYNEEDVINGFYTYDGALPAKPGTFVKISVGWSGANQAVISNPGSATYNNALSPRWGVPAKVVPVNGSGDNAIGMLLYEVRETDENGEKLIWHRKKAENNNWTISGEGCTIVTKGIFSYSGVGGIAAAGNNAYLGANGNVNTSGAVGNDNVTKVGKFLGGSTLQSDNYVLFKLEL